MTGRRVLFLGSKALGLRILKLIHEVDPESLVGVVTLDDRDDGRSVFDAMKVFCEAQELPLKVAKNRSDAEAIVASSEPDLCFVCGWYWLFSETVLAVPSMGFAGIHNSLLPRYRGGAPLVWALINGESEVGSTIFRFTPGMDDGPYWGQVRVKVNSEAAIGEVLGEVEEAVVGKLQEIFPDMLTGALKPKPQDDSAASYCSQRGVDDGWIDWRWPAARIHNFIRAQSQPYPGARTALGEEALILWKARPFPGTYDGPPGKVVRSSKREFWVACGERSGLIVKEWQPEAGDNESPSACRIPLGSQLRLFKN